MVVVPKVWDSGGCNHARFDAGCVKGWREMCRKKYRRPWEVRRAFLRHVAAQQIAGVRRRESLTLGRNAVKNKKYRAVAIEQFLN